MPTQRLNTMQAAVYLGTDISYKTLQTYRVRGGGPVYMKLGKRVVYDTADLDTWLASRRRQSTTVAVQDAM